ncbi:hypothetical protein HAZT_HAZT001710 [Hyalella azteca]|uniref:Vacuolar protein sorting-associated protein 54 N-terminal domain-containing protein n=1 Tax=Hyalella azteca TaxID=294128 RepID=A0A6A0H0H2_HYAAZ|nr:hypothetical protein HAZT_HAZT001710 [Hyalella azteca]
MDIKEKLKTFIDKKTNKTAKHPPTTPAYLAASENWTTSDFDNHLAVIGHQNRKASICEEIPLSNEAQDVVIDTIETIYFQSDNPDVGSHELQKFPDISDIHVINGIRSRLRKQHAIVSRRVSDLIISKQTACMEEMAKIDRIQKEGCLAVALCVQSRRKLSVGKDQFTSASLRVIANHLKRQRIVEVMNNLKTIKTLQMTDIQLQKLLRAEAYPSAIQLLLECQTAASTFRHFSCISDLSAKLQETLEMAEEQLDCAIGRVVVNFNANTYAKLHSAYMLLNKRQALMDQLHMHLTSHIHNSAFSIVMGYVELYSSVSQLNISNIANNSINDTNNSINCDKATQSSFSKMQYSELCKYVDHECFLACYLDLCKSMFAILRNYKAISRWHHNEAEEMKQLKSEASSLRSSPTKSPVAENCSVNERSYVEQKLIHGLHRIWQDVQAKIRTFILASDLSHFKFDDFLLVLDITSRLISIGEDFCGSKSEALQDSIKKQSMGFFHHEHAARLEELHMFLENEAWQIVPLKPTFTVYHLLEYRFLKRKDASFEKSLVVAASPAKKNGK